MAVICDLANTTLQVIRVTIALPNMDDLYTVKFLHQSLIDASERENRLQSALQTAKEDAQEWKEQAMVSKIMFQELDDAFEVEEAKTNDERLARQEADERTRQYQAEVLKAKRREINANEQCDSAESEVLRLEEDLAAERSAAVAADLHLCRLREDLALAERNESAAYEQRDTLEAKVCTLRDDVGIATDRMTMLERQARAFDTTLEYERLRAGKAEDALDAIAQELRSTKIKLSYTLEKYSDLEAQHITSGSVEPETPFDTGSVAIDKIYDTKFENGDSFSSKHDRGLLNEIDRGMAETMVHRATLSTWKNPPIMATEMPTFPKPARLRPALASATACRTEVVKATGRMFTGPRADLKTPLWKWMWMLRDNHCTFPFKGSKLRRGLQQGLYESGRL